MVSLDKANNILIINSHPIQYFAPLYKQLATQQNLQLKVLYCSKHGLEGEVDQQFGTSVRWDIPLLDGYSHEFISNQSLKPSIYTFWGLLNLSVLTYLWKAPKSIVWVHGWAYAVCWLTIMAAKLMGHTVCLRGESPLRLEKRKKTWLQKARQLILGRGLFQFVDYFLYVGQQNRAFYKHMGVRPNQLVHCPYAVDNEWFQAEATKWLPHRQQFRTDLGMPAHAFVILYSGKYIPKKRPLDLLKAVAESGCSSIATVLMGEGPLRTELETYIRQQSLPNVYLTGFVNQSLISRYYAAADIFVMCSTDAETWGLSTNEAMNFGLPIVLSDQVGGADDLVVDGQNGYAFPCGDVEKLAELLRKLAQQSAEERWQMGQQSRLRVKQYSYDQIIRSLQQHILAI